MHHLSYTTHHTPLLIHHSSYTTHHTPLITHHSSYTTHHTPLVIHDSSHTTHHTPLIIHRSSYTTHHTPLIIHQSSYTSHHATSHHTPPHHTPVTPLIIHHCSYTTHHTPLYTTQYSRIWTSNLPSRRQFPYNPSFDCCLAIPKQSPGGGSSHALIKHPLGYEPLLPGTCHMRYQVSFTCSSRTVEALAGPQAIGKKWFRPEKVKATSSFACQLQSTHKDLSRVDLDLPEGLLVGLGCAATSPDSPLDFRQAQNAAERSGRIRLRGNALA